MELRCEYTLLPLQSSPSPGLLHRDPPDKCVLFSLSKPHEATDLSPNASVVSLWSICCSQGMSLSAGSSCTRPQVSCGRSRIRCYCGEEASLRMSWKVMTFGRRFFNCPKMQPEQCSFFDWLDNPTCQRGHEVGQKVQDKIRQVEDKVNVLKMNEKRLQKECERCWNVVAMQSDDLKKSNKRERNAIRLLIVSWVFFIVILAWLLVHVRFPSYGPYLP